MHTLPTPKGANRKSKIPIGNRLRLRTKVVLGVVSYPTGMPHPLSPKNEFSGSKHIAHQRFPAKRSKTLECNKNCERFTQGYDLFGDYGWTEPKRFASYAIDRWNSIRLVSDELYPFRSSSCNFINSSAHPAFSVTTHSSSISWDFVREQFLPVDWREGQSSAR